jgi:hypothetical protein
MPEKLGFSNLEEVRGLPIRSQEISLSRRSDNLSPRSQQG